MTFRHVLLTSVSHHCAVQEIMIWLLLWLEDIKRSILAHSEIEELCRLSEQAKRL